MESLEKKYYEASRFWEDGAFDDAGNIERIRSTINIIPASVTSLVDAGCGNGLFLNALLKQKPAIQSYGFDRSEEAIKYVKTRKGIGDVTDIHLEDQSFDCVTCLEVIEHLPIDVFDDALKELARVSGEYIIISVPYKEQLEENYTKCPQCKSMFNADLHLRSFDEQKMHSLFTSYGYKCISQETLGKSIRYKGHYKFRQLLYPNQFRQWKSPLCPICGYQDLRSSDVAMKTVEPEKKAEAKSNPPRSLVSYVTWLPKLIWPKEAKYYWILALYQKTK